MQSESGQVDLTRASRPARAAGAHRRRMLIAMRLGSLPVGIDRDRHGRGDGGGNWRSLATSLPENYRNEGITAWVWRHRQWRSQPRRWSCMFSKWRSWNDEAVWVVGSVGDGSQAPVKKPKRVVAVWKPASKTPSSVATMAEPAVMSSMNGMPVTRRSWGCRSCGRG